VIQVSLDPFGVTLPGPGPFAGRIAVELPEHHVKLYDLSMGGVLPGAHVGGEGRVFHLEMDVPEPGLTASEIMEWLAGAQEQLRELHAVVQRELDKLYLMEGKR